MKVVGEIRLKLDRESWEHSTGSHAWPLGSVESRVAARRLLEERKNPQATDVIRFIEPEPSDFPGCPVLQQAVREAEAAQFLDEPPATTVPEAVMPANYSHRTNNPAPAPLLEKAVLETEAQKAERRRAHGYTGPYLPIAPDGAGGWMG